MKTFHKAFIAASLLLFLFLSCKPSKKNLTDNKKDIITQKVVTTNETLTEKNEQASEPVAKTIGAEEFHKKIETGNIQLLDVRTQREFQANRIKGAKNFDIYKRSFIEDVVNGGIDKSKPLYIYCLTGARSRSGLKKLVKAGFTEVYDLSGGIKRWHQKGYKIEN